MNAWGVTDTGKVRTENQDYYIIDLMPESRQAICVVCDGMGGAKAGNVASELAAKTFAEQLRVRMHQGMKRKNVENAMEIAIASANEAVHRKSRDDQRYSGMGTTLVGFAVNEDVMSIVNVGDSRAYLINEDGITRITRDHSLVEDLVRHGGITPEQAKVHPGKNLITRAIGTGSTVNGDYYSMRLEKGDVILLCSDGLSNLLNDQEILYEVIHGGALEDCCTRLANIVLERGAPDNVTALIFEYETEKRRD